MWQVCGQTVWVSGASSGVGEVLAYVLGTEKYEANNRRMEAIVFTYSDFFQCSCTVPNLKIRSNSPIP